jgi:hypothetical protein
MFQLKQTVLIIATCLLLMNCKKKETATLTSSVVGFVTLYDTKGNPLPSNSGVTVTIEGTNTSTITDSTGKYVISDLNLGENCFVYTKAGYGTWKKFSTFGTANTSNPYFTTKVTLLPICSRKIQSLIVKDSLNQWGDDFKIVSGTILPVADSLNPICLYFTFGNSTSFSFENTKYTLSTTVQSGSFRYVIQSYQVTDILTACGNSPYLISYCSNLPNNQYLYYNAMNTSYYDYDLGKTIYPTNGPASSAVHFTIKVK